MNSTTSETLEFAPAPVECRPGIKELWQRYHRHGDIGEENQLVEQYLPLVKTIVGRLAMTLPSHVNLEDLQSAGLLGLLQAVRKYNPDCRTSFETYARVRIKGAVLDELRRMDWVPRLVHDKARKIQNAMNQLEQTLGGLPTEEQVASALDLPVEEYRRWLDEIRPATFVCLDAALHRESNDPATQYEGIADESQAIPDETVSRRELANLIVERLNQLPEIQRKVLALYYFEDLRLREIAEIFNLTESRICQIHAQAILAIRSYVEKCEEGVSLTAA